MNELISYYKSKISISWEIENKLVSLIKEKTLAKGEKILSANSYKKEHIFVVEGCLRSYFITNTGKDKTIQFAIKDWWIADYLTLYTNNKSVLDVESITKSRVLTIDKEAVNKLYLEYPEFNVLQRKNFEKHTATLQKRILGLLTQTAEERYEEFVSNYSNFEAIIPNYHIASYLGITPESLSRIRKNRTQK